MSPAKSPLPLPSAPWHIAQSMPQVFFAVASTAGVGFTGFGFCASAGGIVSSAVAGGGPVLPSVVAGGGACCANTGTAARKTSGRKRTDRRIGPSDFEFADFAAFYSRNAARVQARFHEVTAGRY